MIPHLEDPTAAFVPQIAAIWHSGWHDAHAAHVPHALTQLRSLDSFVERVPAVLPDTRVAVQNGAVIGFNMVKGDELYQMYVSDAARGTGVAQALIADAEARIRAAGHGLAWLACAIGNARAVRFYEKTGWINAGRVSVDLDTTNGIFPLDVWRYEKRM